MNVISVQSWVAHGHVGNAAALFALQRLGAEVAGIHTVNFSNHTGYGDWTGRAFDADEIRAIGEGLARRGVFETADALLSGYAGSAAIGEAILDLRDRMRAARRDAVHLCDPVMGDEGRGLFVRPELVAFFRDRAVPGADIVTPNRFELGVLAGTEIGEAEAARAAARKLLARLPEGRMRAVLVTSLEDVPAARPGAAGHLDLMLCTDRGTWRLSTERVPFEVNGAGDLLAALFLFHALDRGDPVAAFGAAVGAVWGVIAATARLGRRELALVAAQEELVRPSRRFEPVPW